MKYEIDTVWNKLTVIGHFDGRVVVLCECGKVKKVRGGGLGNGKIKSCGCLRGRYLPGTKWHRLRVLRRIDGNRVEVECDCGTVKIVQAADLSANIKSCGCLRRKEDVKEKSVKTLPHLTHQLRLSFWQTYTEALVKPKLGPCWEWGGICNSGGRGIYTYKSEKYYAYRFSYNFAHGNPEDFKVCHKCDNTKCINPFHLFIGTDADNVKDKIDKGRDFKPDGVYCGSNFTADQIKEIRNGPETSRHYAKKFNCTESNISQIRERKTHQGVYVGSKPNPHRIEPKLNEEQVREIRLSQDSKHSLARKYKVDKNVITRNLDPDRRTRFAWTQEERDSVSKRKNEPGNKVKFTLEQISEALTLKDVGWTDTALAKKYGVSRSLISIRLKQARG